MKRPQISKDRLKSQARDAGRFAAYVLQRFQLDGGLSMASALSYTSLLAIVPLLAIALAMLAAFPAFDGVREQLQTVLFQNLVPEVGNAVLSWVRNFVANAGRLTTAGIIGLAFTAVMLLVTIEGSLNVIFRVTTDRGPLSRLLVYWTTLTLGPMLIGASFSLTGYLAAVQKWGTLTLGGGMKVITGVLPTLLSVFAFTLIYMVVPNRKVQTRDALKGGVVAAVLFALLRWGFAHYVSSARTYQSVYGAVSTLPIFLMWMYFSWSMVLIGAQVTASLPEWRLGRRKVLGYLPARRRLGNALQVLEVLYRAAQEGKVPVGRRELLDRTTHDERQLVGIMDLLLGHGFIAKMPGQRYLLARDLESVSLHDLVTALDLGLVPEDAAGLADGLGERLRTRIEEASRVAQPALSISLRDLLKD